MTNIDLIASDIDSLTVSKAYLCPPERCLDYINNKDLNILQMNIRSIHKNFNEFQALLIVLKIDCDIIILTECWTNITSHAPRLNGYTSTHTKNVSNQNDGVTIYVKDGLKCRITEPAFMDGNCLICQIDDNTTVVAIYRSPSYRHLDNFLHSLNQVLASLRASKTVALIGDLNIDIKISNYDSRSSDYLTFLASHGMLPAHQFPTRDKNCLDHVILRTNNIATTLVLETYITDHLPTLLNIKTNKTNPKPKYECSRIDYEAVRIEINETDFTTVMLSTNANLATNQFIEILSDIIKKHTHIFRIPKKNRNIKPWITTGLLRCIRNRDKLHKKHKRFPDNPIIRTTYTRYRNFCTKLLRNIKTEYEKGEFEKAKNNPKATWDVIKNITDYKKKQTPPNELLKLSSDVTTSLNSVNKFFAKIGETLASNITPINHPSTTPPPPSMTHSQCNSLVIVEVDEVDVRRIITSLKTDCATGWDGISGKILKLSLEKVVPPIAHICNVSISTGIFPLAFKKAIVHPIYKNGERDNISNYRPISVLPTLSKILERILNNALVSYLERHRIISDNQYGFRTGKSTEDAILELTDYTAKKLDIRSTCLGVFLDLSKAFDTVSVPLLLGKLEYIGVRGITLAIFKDYLTNRLQSVKIGSNLSGEESITYGVPQGSILGPTLFLIYINQLCQLQIDNCKIISYADDTALLIHGSDWTETKIHTEHCLGIVTSWLAANLLTLNITKTTYITFSLVTNNLPSPTYNIRCHTCCTPTNNCTCLLLTRATHVKYLGVQLDQRLDWHTHLEALISRVRKLIYIFKTLRHSADTNTLKMVYLSLCQSLLLYCSPIWGGASKTKFLQLERAQRAVLKVMTSKPFRYPTKQLYQDTKVLTVRQLCILRTILRVHTTLSFNPSYLAGRRRKRTVCPHVTHRTVFASRQYYCLGYSLYNKINNALNIYPKNLHDCKTKLNAWLLNLTYSETEDLYSHSQ
jgi:hypothetical protein